MGGGTFSRKEKSLRYFCTFSKRTNSTQTPIFFCLQLAKTTSLKPLKQPTKNKTTHLLHRQTTITQPTAQLINHPNNHKLSSIFIQQTSPPPSFHCSLFFPHEQWAFNSGKQRALSLHNEDINGERKSDYSSMRQIQKNKFPNWQVFHFQIRVKKQHFGNPYNFIFLYLFGFIFHILYCLLFYLNLFSIIIVVGFALISLY